MNKEDKYFASVLKANRWILIKNIIPHEDLLTALRQQNVFPGSMVKEIEVSRAYIFNKKSEDVK